VFAIAEEVLGDRVQLVRVEAVVPLHDLSGKQDGGMHQRE